MKKFDLLLISLLIISMSSCIFNVNGINGNGKIVTKTKTLGSFNAIDARGAFDIVLKQGQTESISIVADENLMDYIIVKNNSGRLLIDSRQNLDPTNDVIVTITFKSIENIELSGACDLKSDETLFFKQIKFDCDGASECKLNLEAVDCKFELSGASELELKGKTQNALFDGSGAVDIEAKAFEIANCRVDLSGASKAELFITQTLELDLSGAASLRYSGGASITRQNISGAASIKAN